MTQSPAHVVPRIVPQLPYADVIAAIDFLERGFGFREIREARIEHTGGVHAELELGEARVTLGGPGDHGTHPPGDGTGASCHLTCYVDDIDAHFERARAAGATILVELEDTFWGERCYEALDPEDHRWRFHQFLGRRLPIQGDD